MRWLNSVLAGGFVISVLQGCNLSEPLGGDNQSAVKGEIWPLVTSAVQPNPEVEARVKALVSQMTLEEKIGQMIQPEIKFITPDQVKEFHIGSVLNGGGTAPNNDKFAPVSDWVALADAYYLASSKGNSAGIPLIWGSDAVHGHNNVVGATLFPHNIGLGAARDSELIRRIGSATAKEVSVTGIDWTFAPTVAVVRDDRWGRTYESYSEDPGLVREYAAAMVKGIQGEATSRFGSRHVVATAKHFVGDGGTTRGIDRGDTQITEQELLDIHAAGFIAALESGVQTVMASFNSWNGVRMHGNYYLLTEVLKQRMGFDGFVVGDWNGHRHIPGCSVTSCAAAINAGLDMFMVPSDWQELYLNTLEQARTGEISMERIDDAVTRIVRVKVRAGLMDKGLVSKRELSAKEAVLGGADHRALAREAVRKSIVLLKNNHNLLPLRPDQSVLVAGSGADDIGKQSGGWTLSWQGTGNTDADFPNANSIYDGIKAVVESSGGRVVLRENGSTDLDSDVDVAIVVIGEEPYAEWHGDVATIEYQHGQKEDLALLQQLQREGIPTVTIFLSGRPLWVNPEINASDAFVAAWLPGSEGAGVADVLFTDANGLLRNDFVGKLSFSWPRYIHQSVLNVGQTDYDPLFPYGYGLNYQDSMAQLPRLNEERSAALTAELDEAWLLVSRIMKPWDLYIDSGENIAEEVTGNLQVVGADSNLKVTSVDKVSQEDARQILWQGLESGTAYLRSSTPQDFTGYLARDGFLQLAIKVDQAPEQPVYLGMECGEDCAARVPLHPFLNTYSNGQWQSLKVALSCFDRQGMDFSNVQVPFSLNTGGALAVTVADIKVLTPSQVGEPYGHTLSCEG
jgi:beta-glucosidase